MSFQLVAWASSQRTGSITRKAVLFALANAANHHTGRCDPSVARICEETEAGPTAVKDALSALVAQGLIERKRKRRADGSLGTYSYTFPHVEVAKDLEPGDGLLETAGDPRPEPGNGSQNLEGLEPGKDLVPNGTRSGRVLTTVDRKRVTDLEEEQAHEILEAWNERTGQTLRSKDWLAKIVMRLRERPELELADHIFIIEAGLASPWWKGEPTPSVIYGNGAQFERQIMAARRKPAATRAFELAAEAIESERRRTA